MPFEIHVEKFKGPEAALITGLSASVIRDHRRRGFLPASPDRHPRYDLFDLMRFAYIADVSAFGIGPAASYAFSEWVAHSALQFALRNPAAAHLEGFEGPVSDGMAAGLAREGFGRPRMLANDCAVIWADGQHFSGDSTAQAERWRSDRGLANGVPYVGIDVQHFANRIVGRLPRVAVRARVMS